MSPATGTDRSGRPARLLRAHAAWIVAATLAVLAGAWAYAGTLPRAYVAQASVVVQTAVVPGAAPVAPVMATEKWLATSGVVLDRAAASAGLSPAELTRRVAVRVPPDASVLELECSAPAARQAQQCAQALADAYVAVRNQPRGDTSGPATASPVAARVVTPADLPDAPATGAGPTVLALGLLAGLLLGIGTAFLRDLLDDRVRDADDMTRRTGVPVLAVLPALPSGTAAAGPVRVEPGAAEAEAFRHLRVRLESATGGGGPGAVLVTSPGAHEDHASVALNLALAFARADARVLLVDGDLRAPRLHQAFSASGAFGLTTLLADEATPAGVRQLTDAHGLDLVAAGDRREDLTDLLTRRHLERVIGDLRVGADVVVTDCAPVLVASDAAALAGVHDVVLLVAQMRRTTRASLGAARRDLGERDGLAVLGVLLEAAPGRVARRLRGLRRLRRPFRRRAEGGVVAPPEVPSAPDPAVAPGPTVTATVTAPPAAAAANGAAALAGWDGAPAAAGNGALGVAPPAGAAAGLPQQAQETGEARRPAVTAPPETTTSNS